MASRLGFAQVTSAQRRTLLAAALGWMLDAFDAMLYALVLTYIMRDLGMSKALAGSLGSLTLLASGIGGVAFGFLADRIGRKRALMLSILTYSICSFASGLSTSVLMLAVFRFILGLGMGGEWNTGATLVAETWPTELRAKAIAIVQSSWAIGYAFAALVAGIVLHYADWRMVFFVGILPALVTLWIQKGVPESEMWRAHRAKTVALADGEATLRQPAPIVETGFIRIFQPPFAKHTFALLYTFLAALLVPLYAMVRAPAALLVLGTIVAFFGTGFFSGSGIIGSEIFPTSVRARALGFTYNGARTMSSVAPYVIGRAGQAKGLSWAFYLCGLSFLLACMVATQLPETKGKQLE